MNSTIKTSLPLRLEEYYYTVQEVKANPSWRPTEEPWPLPDVVLFNSDVNEDGTLYLQVILQAESEEDKLPYEVRLAVFGIFRYDEPDVAEDETSNDRRLRAAINSGAQLLIGALRERLALLTAQSPWGEWKIDLFPMAHVRRAPLPASERSET